MVIWAPAVRRGARRAAGRPNATLLRHAGHAKARRRWPLAGITCVIAVIWAVISAPPLAAQVQISGLSDLALGSWNGTSDMEGEVDHCVLGNRGGRFSIEATGDGSGNSFVLANGPVSLPYQVAYNDGSGWSQMSSGTPLAGQRGSQNAQQFGRCLDGSRPPERVRVRVLAQDLSGAIGGGYSGTLTLLVAPE